MDGWVRGCVRAWVHVSVRLCVRACVREHIDGWVRAWIGVCVDGCVRACVRGSVGACMRVCVDCSVCAYMDGHGMHAPGHIHTPIVSAAALDVKFSGLDDRNVVTHSVRENQRFLNRYLHIY